MLIEEIIEERDNIIMKKLNGEKISFQRLRSLCEKYNENEEEGKFDLSSDKALWISVNGYFTKLLKKS